MRRGGMRVLAGTGPPGRLARHEAQRTGDGLDRGRHRIPQERNALGWGGAPVLRTARETGKLSGSRQPAGRRKRYMPSMRSHEPGVGVGSGRSV
jgi:hypothetical protein